jgi:hypothetical protein
MSPNVIVTWTLATAFIVVILAAVAYSRYLLHSQPRSIDEYGFVIMTIMTPPNDAPAQRSLSDPTTPDLATNRIPTYLDLSALRPPGDTSR